MAALLLFVCAVLACQTQAQYLPRLPSPLPPQLCNPPPKVCNPPPVICNPPSLPCNPPPIPCNPPPVVCNPPPVVCNPPSVPCNPPPVVCNSPQPCSTTTQVVVDNSVSNALANALQLLIVSNLIENTMKPQCGCDPIQTIYSPNIDCLTPINPYNPYDNIITPCEIVASCPCDPIEVIPTVCYPEYPIPNIGCGCDRPNYGLATVVPNYGCGCDSFGPNIGCGCDNSRYLPNVGCDNCNCPRYGCDCDRYTIQNYGLPNIGCGCDGPKFGIQNIGYELLANALGVRCGCDLPLFAPQNNCNCGFPNLPVGINVEPLGYVDSCGCPNKCIYY